MKSLGGHFEGNITFDINEFYFEGLDRTRPSKILFISLSIVLTVLSILASYGIIWFERFGSDQKRIFSNQVIALVSWSTIAWYILVQPVDIFLYFYRPLPEAFCLFQLLLKNALVFQVST